MLECDIIQHMRRIVKHYFIPHEGNSYRPHLFHHKSILAIALFSVAIFVLSLGYSSILSRIDYLASVLPSVLIDLTNDNRQLYNLSPLARNPILEAAAQEKASDMARFSYFAHISPTGITPWYWFTKSGYRFIYAGENLAVNFSDSSVVSQAWMNSPGHRANILNQQFTEIGIATAEGIYQGRPTVFVAQFFGRPAPAPVALPSPSPISPTPAFALAPPGEPVPVQEPKVEPVTETDTFIAVKNAEIPDSQITEVKPSDSDSQGLTSGEAHYATLPQKVLSSPKTLLHLVYYVLIAIVLLAMVISLAIELRRHHGKHLLSGVAVVLFLIILAYFYQYLIALPVTIA